MSIYFAQISPAEDMPGAYCVFFPDLDGCNTFGDNLAEALCQAKDCLTGYLNTCARLGEDIPSPSSLAEVKKKAEAYCRELGEDIAEGTFYQAIQPGPLDEKPVEVSISMLPSLVREIDEAAKSAGLTRSGFLALAAKKYASEIEAAVY